MKKNKLMLFSVVTLLSFSAMGTVNNINNMTAQAKATKVTKKHHKEHLSKHEKLLQEVRASVKHPKKSQKATETTKNDKIANGYNYTKNEITDFNEYSNVYVQTALNEINHYRTKNGINPLSLDSKLINLAKERAEQGYQYRNESWYDGHRDQNGTPFVEQLAPKYGITIGTFAENVQSGSFSGMDSDLENPIEAAKSLTNSNYIEGPQGGHYQSMMNPKYTKIGIAIYVGPNQGEQTAGGEAEEYSN